MSNNDDQSGIVIKVTIKFPGVAKLFKGSITPDKFLADRLLGVYEHGGDPVEHLDALLTAGNIVGAMVRSFIANEDRR